MGAGACVDDCSEEFGVLVGQVAAKLHASVGGGQRQGFAGVGLVFLRFGAVGVENVSYSLTCAAQLGRREMPSQPDQLPLSYREVFERDRSRDALQRRDNHLGLRRSQGYLRSPVVGRTCCLARVIVWVEERVRRGEGGGDGRVLRQRLSQPDITTCLRAVESVAELDQLSCVVRADLCGLPVLVESGDQVQSIGFQSSKLTREPIESGELLLATHRPDRPLVQYLHATYCRRAHRQFSEPDRLVSKAIPCPQLSGIVDIASGNQM